MTRSLLLFLGLAACAPETAPSTPPCDDAVDHDAHPRAAAYGDLLAAFVDANEMPGAIVGIQQGQDDPWIGAWGVSNLSHGDPMQTCTPFRTGSITKMLVGTLAMQLVDAGDLGLDDPIVDHVPDLRGNVRDVEWITVRELLNHTSGLPHPSDDDLAYGLWMLDDPARAAATPYADKLERFVYGHPLRFEPGTDSYYSNAGAWVLARVVEERTGQPIAAALHDRLFAPNGLDDTRLATGPDRRLARGYGRVAGVADVTDWDRMDSDGDPAGGVSSTAADLLAFGRLLFHGGLVSDDTLAAMQQTTRFPTCPNRDCEFGLGLESLHAYPVVGYGKNGSLPGVDANLFVFPERDLTLVVFANWGSGNRKDVFATLFE